MNVLSLFDGISCGRVALERAGIRVDNYFASEIDKYAIKIAQKNYPDTIQLGDINDWESWDLPPIDLVMGGSPCQGFSVAGKRMNFDDPRSQLYFKFLEILKHYNPRYFLLENVKMSKDCLNIITESIGVEPVHINSRLVSAQNRQRLYWFNWDTEPPEDRELVLSDVLEYGYVDRDKAYCIDANYFKGGNLKQYFQKSRRQLVFDSPVSCYDDAVGVKYRNLIPVECERLQTLPDGFTEGVSNAQRYKAIGNGWTVDVIAHIFSSIS